MATIATKEIPAKVVDEERRSEVLTITTPKGQDYLIHSWHSLRIDGAIVNTREGEVKRSLSAVENEPCGSTGLTIGQVAAGIAQTIDRWRAEDMAAAEQSPQ